MKECPIIFSGPMVRAILDGRKTQTRRIIKPQPVSADDKIDALFKFWIADVLWVREAHAFMPRNAYALPKIASPTDADMAAYYREGFDRSGKIIWRPSIHMPRWASRITLKVTGVNVERLQDISRGDAMDEGCPHPNMQDGPNPRDWFSTLWGSIHGPGSWESNPWVCAITFERVQP